MSITPDLNAPIDKRIEALEAEIQELHFAPSYPFPLKELYRIFPVESNFFKVKLCFVDSTFSPQEVDEIDLLYRKHFPGKEGRPITPTFPCFPDEL